jgi:hypothetical protein
MNFSLNRRRILTALLAASTLPVWAAATQRPIRRVLFVGNSFTYHNDLPATFAQVASVATGQDISADMLARGGASLSEQLDFGVLQKIVGAGQFDAMVLQERGGLLRCTPRWLEECEKSKAAHRQLSALGTQHGMRGVLLGTFQNQRTATQQLQEQEQDIARECGLAHLIMADTDLLRGAHPDLEWVDRDGFHPGPDWTLLAAIRLTRLLFQRTPRASALRLNYRDFRDAQSPSYDRLASSRDVGAAVLTRKLESAEYAKRLALIEVQQPAPD